LNGDIFDKVKPASYEEIAAFFEFVDKISPGVDVYVIAGNHEEIKGTTTIFDYLPEHSYRYLKTFTLEFMDSVRLHCVGHPYLETIMGGLLVDEDKYNILISHYRSDIGVAVEEVDNDYVSEHFDYAVLSDIHLKYCPKKNICYTSSPYGVHYDRPGVYYGYFTIDIPQRGNAELQWVPLDLPTKVRLDYAGRENKKDFEDWLDSVVEPQNLYKVVVPFPSSAEFMEVVGKYKNIKVVKFLEEFSEEDTDFSEIIDELQEANNANLVDTIHRLVKDTSELPEKTLDVGYQTLKSLV
jgi:DNA repair exonuclease SbcCD nuclease subunit